MTSADPTRDGRRLVVVPAPATPRDAVLRVADPLRVVEIEVTVDHRQGDRVVVLGLSGSLVGDSCGRVVRQLETVFGLGRRRIVIDCTSVDRLDRAGVQVLIDAVERAADWDLPLSICAPAGHQLWTSRIALLTGVLCPTPTAAVATVRERYLPGEPTRIDLMRAVEQLTAAVTTTVKLMSGTAATDG